MQWANRLSHGYRSGRFLREAQREETYSIRGTIQRVDYRRRELRVIAEGRAWRFGVADHCRLVFNYAPAILRCFHPLDPVTVIFRRDGEEDVAIAMYSEERTQPCSTS